MTDAPTQRNPCAEALTEGSIADPQPSLFGLRDLAHADNPVQAFLDPIPGVVKRLVVAPVPTGTVRRPTLVRCLAVSADGSRWVAPVIHYDGCSDTLIAAIRAHITADPAIRCPAAEHSSTDHSLETVRDLEDARNWRLWLDSPEVATPVPWSWATSLSKALSHSGAAATSRVDPIQLISHLGTVRLQRLVTWALEGLAPSLRVLTKRRVLPQRLLLQLIANLDSNRIDSEDARRNLEQAVATQPIGLLRWLVEGSESGSRLFVALCNGDSLSVATRRECPGTTPGALRHAVRGALIVPDAAPSTWRVLLQALPRIGRRRWPVLALQWAQLLDVVRAAERAGASINRQWASERVIESVAVASQYLPLGPASRPLHVHPHWTSQDARPGQYSVSALADRLVAFRFSAQQRMEALSDMPDGPDSSCSAAAEAQLERFAAALDRNSDVDFARELNIMVADCPAVRLGALTCELVRSVAEAGAIGSVLGNCLRGAGKWRFATYLRSGMLLAKVSENNEPIGVFTITVEVFHRRPRIETNISIVFGARNRELPLRAQAAARHFADVLEEGVFGLDRYAAVMHALNHSLR